MIQSLSFSSIDGFFTSNFQSLLRVTEEQSEFFILPKLYWSQRISLVISEVFPDFFGCHFMNYEVIPWGATSSNSFASLTCFLYLDKPWTVVGHDCTLVWLASQVIPSIFRRNFWVCPRPNAIPPPRNTRGGGSWHWVPSTFTNPRLGECSMDLSGWMIG